jgi:hypothetical protein
MARVSYTVDQVRQKLAIGERLKLLRLELRGEQDYAVFTRSMGIPLRSWYNYELGNSIPAEVILRIIEATDVEPMWLLHGTEPRYREPAWPPVNLDPQTAVPILIRAALELWERSEPLNREPVRRW